MSMNVIAAPAEAPSWCAPFASRRKLIRKGVLNVPRFGRLDVRISAPREPEVFLPVEEVVRGLFDWHRAECAAAAEPAVMVFVPNRSERHIVVPMPNEAYPPGAARH